MATILAHFFTPAGAPLAAPVNAPTVRIRRVDTGALVVTDLAMTELGDGAFRFDFTETAGARIDHSFRCDGDPTASGQTDAGARYVVGGFSWEDSLLRKVLINNATTTDQGGGVNRLRLMDDDDATAIATLDVNTNGTRTKV